jgi:biopolymer transport protein TolR
MQQRVEVPTKSEVDLPPDVNQDQVVLTYTKDRVIFLNRDTVSVFDLGKRLSEIFKNRREKTIFLNVDPDANYGESLEVIAKVRMAGLEKIAVITLKPGEQFRDPRNEATGRGGM